MANKNKEEYRKQVQRIKRAMKRLEKHGYMFTESPLPDEEPARPTRQQIENLERMNTERLYYRTVMADQETGELLAQGRRLTRAERQKQLERKGKLNLAHQYSQMVSDIESTRGTPVTDGTETVGTSNIRANIIIDNFIENCQRSMREAEKIGREKSNMLYDRVMNWLHQQVSKFGEEDVAEMIEEGASAGVLPVFEVFYREDVNTTFIVELTKFLKESGSDYVDDVTNSIDEGVYDYTSFSSDEFNMEQFVGE